MSLLLARLSSVGCLVLTAAPRVGDQRTHDSQSPKKEREESRSGPKRTTTKLLLLLTSVFSVPFLVAHPSSPPSSSLHPFAPRLIFLKRPREKKNPPFCGSWLVGSVAESLARSPSGRRQKVRERKRTFKELQG